MTDITRKLLLNVDIPEQLLADTIITAIEGGIGYWSQCVTYTWTEGPEHTRAEIIEIGDGDMEEEKHFTINCDVVMKGITALIECNVLNMHQETVKGRVPLGLRGDIVKAIVLGCTNPDEADWDAEVADCIVQAGLFNDVVYG